MKSGFNDAYITSRYKAYKDGVFVEIVVLTNDRKKQFEEKGWTFVRTNLRVGDRLGSQSD